MRSNVFVIEELAQRLGVAHYEGFGKTENELIGGFLRASGRGTLEEIQQSKWIDCQPDFDESHYVKGFAHADGKFHFRADWENAPWSPPPQSMGLQGPVSDAPALPDYWEVIDVADDAHPYRMATSPARTFLNSTFTETPGSKQREGKPTVMIHPEDAGREGIAEGDKVQLSNALGAVIVHATLSDGVKRGVVVVESIHPNSAHEDGKGINTLTSAQTVAPHGGAAFHDTKVAVARMDRASI